MPYKISGNVASESRILVLKETDYSVESSTVETGAYEIEDLDDSNKLVLARNVGTGEAEGYGLVSPEYYDNTPVDLDITLTTGADDGHLYTDNGTFESTTAVGMNLAAGNSSRHSVCWWRFRNINIPQGSTINSAYIRATWNATNSNSFNTAIRIENSDNAVQLNSAADYSTRSWLYITNMTGNATAGVVYQTPSLLSGVQSVINRVGWSSGNSLQFSTGPYQSSRLWRFYTSEGGVAAHLHINYTAP